MPCVRACQAASNRDVHGFPNIRNTNSFQSPLDGPSFTLCEPRTELSRTVSQVNQFASVLASCERSGLLETLTECCQYRAINCVSHADVAHLLLLLLLLLHWRRETLCSSSAARSAIDPQDIQSKFQYMRRPGRTGTRVNFAHYAHVCVH